VGKGRPTLRLTVAAGKAAPGFRSLSIRLPRALRFAHKTSQVTVTGLHHARLRFSASVRHGVLTVRLRHATTLAKLTVRYATLTTTRHEAAAARRGRAHKLRITVTVIDSHGTKTTLHTTAKPH
jgi:hypothetical protein